MLGNMYMPLEVPLGELAVAPVNPVHEELVRKIEFDVSFGHSLSKLLKTHPFFRSFSYLFPFKIEFRSPSLDSAMTRSSCGQVS